MAFEPSAVTGPTLIESFPSILTSFKESQMSCPPSPTLYGYYYAPGRFRKGAMTLRQYGHPHLRHKRLSTSEIFVG